MVVRGAYRGVDPVFASASHSSKANSYVVVEQENGFTTARTFYGARDRAKLEQKLADDVFRGVEVQADLRENAGLMPLQLPQHARPLDIENTFRAKSDAELEVLEYLNGLACGALETGGKMDRAFRGVASKHGLKYACDTHKAKGFTQYRGGLQDDKLRSSDVSVVVPQTAAWEARLQRVNKGLDAVEAHLYRGADVSSLNELFLAHVNEGKETVYGDVVHGVGFGSHEDYYKLKRLRAYDYVNVGVTVEGEHGEKATLYRGGRQPKEYVFDEEVYAGGDHDAPAETPAETPAEDVTEGESNEEEELAREGDEVVFGGSTAFMLS